MIQLIEFIFFFVKLFFFEKSLLTHLRYLSKMESTIKVAAYFESFTYKNVNK